MSNLGTPTTKLDFSDFFARPEFQQWHAHFSKAIARRSNPQRHGDLASWLESVSALPEIATEHHNFDNDTVTFGLATELNSKQKKQLRQSLYDLSPWRKGPYQLFDVFIDTEWRSDWKWQRLKPHINDLSGQKVLDVGCGNGYHCWRMLGNGADYVLGIDPSMRFLVQHLAISQYAKHASFDLLPLGIEDMPTNMNLFDSVFSMGVLYHRRTPLNHLHELYQLLNSGGQIVLETLIVDEAANGVFQPEGRYAQMRNVWNILTVQKTLELLAEAGFYEPRCVDQNVTSLQEQRATNWMQYHSLQDFLDPQDLSKTVEGYPAPKRGVFIATKPS